MKVNILDVIDFKKVDSLLEGFNKTTGFVTAILDLEGHVLSQSGWRQICTEFHRINPETAKKCTTSDTVLAGKMDEGEHYHFYKCLNGLVDVAVPLVINGEHIANLFSGQFFFEEPDQIFFKKQAETYGFDEAQYLGSLAKVPVFSVEKVKTAMGFLQNMTQLISETTFQKLEQMELHDAVLKSEERFRSAFLTSPDSININRLSDGLYIDSNEGFTRILGYSREDVVGRTSLEMNIWKNVEERKRLVEGLSRKGYVENLEAQFVCKDGRVIVGLMSASILEIKGEKVFLSVTRDITERKRIENELKEYREHLEDLVANRTAALEAMNKELETFTYSVSHDLKAPLRGIDGYSRLLEEDYADRLDEEGLLFLKNVRQSTTQMNQLIEDLLAYSRMERRDIQPMPIDLRSMIDSMISQRVQDLEARHIKLSVTLPFQTIYSDTETLRQVLANYLDNAVKFSRDDGAAAIEIGGRETDAGWTMWVKDNGIGFDPQYLDRIFEIFQRLHRAEDFPGTGIGLAIVRKAVERIGGLARAESALGRGATFFVDIPKKALC